MTDPSSGQSPQQPVGDAVDPREASNQAPSFPVVGVGASAGGLDALTQFLKALPEDTGMAFVIVQHLAPSHPSALTEILSRTTKMGVQEVQDEPTVEPNHVYVIPPGRSMVIASGKLQLLPRESRGAPHPIDQFFRSLADERRHQAIGVVLSGTATDGTIGLETIKGEGGITFAQDASAQHEGMPHSAIASGCVDFVLSPADIALEIARIGRHAYAVPEAVAWETNDKPNLALVMQLLKQASGVDFAGYKFNTLYRRVTRRMVFQKIEGMDEYVRFLRQNPAELDALYQDILICVTSFFRDPESVDALKSQVFPRLLKDRSLHDPVRLWTLGCSTGQEAYSLAIAFTEAAEAAGSQVPFQLFASDLNAAGIEKARAGVYPKHIEQDVSPERLRRFFTQIDGNYRITKSIRDACIFSRHNVLADPPFSRIDMISCRNLLIYLEPVLQQKIMPALHYALKSEGFLWLGGSETIGTHRNLFEALDAKHKIFVKNPDARPGRRYFPMQPGWEPRTPFGPFAAKRSDATDLPREADRLLSNRFAPPGVVVSAELDILQYRGDTGPFLAPAPGKASLSLLKMLREGLLVAVRAAVLRARMEGAPVREERLRVKSSGGHHEIAIEVIPLKGQGGANDGGFLILFEDRSQNSPRDEHATSRVPREIQFAAPDDVRLAEELAATREYLQSVIEQQEAANEELQSANEEVQSANEELQSANEELETSKEEIQASNEELATVNDELNNRNAELNRVNNDLVNLIGSVEMSIVMLGPDLRVRRFTPMAEKLLNLIPTDVGRPLADIKLNLEGLPELEPLLVEALGNVGVRECEVRDKTGHWYSFRVRPYRTVDNKIDGVVVVLVDVDSMKRAEEVTSHLGAIVRSSDDAIISITLDGVITSWNKGAERLFAYLAEEVVGSRIAILMPPDRVNEESDILSRVRQGETVTHYETVRRRKDGSLLDISLTVSPINDASGRVIGAAKIARDITGRKRADERLQRRERDLSDFFEHAAIGLQWVGPDGTILRANRHELDMLGYSPDEYVGHNIAEFHADGDVIHDILLRLQGGETLHEYEARLRCKDGSIRCVLIDSSVMREDGRFIHTRWFTRDVTESRRAEQALRVSEEFNRTVLESSPDCVKVLDADGCLLTMNTNGLCLMEIDDFAPLSGKEWETLWPTEARRRVAAAVTAVKGGMTERFQAFCPTAKGTQKCWDVLVAPVRDDCGHIVRIVSVSRDITEQREMENELRQNAADLSLADRRKTEFLAMLAHELRNPLAPIRNAVQVLLLTNGSDSAARSASEMMERQVGQMVRLVDDLLDVSRISRGNIELRRGRVELSSVVHQAIEANRSLHDNMGHELTVTLQPSPIYLNADPTRLVQVVGNLLNNACKFTNKGGQISLTTKQEGEEAVIGVRDTGIGIAADQLPLIFDMFMQVDASLERSVSGLGIGLTLVKNLVELHGGTVTVHSAGVGAGSEFMVRLPLSPDLAHLPPHEPNTNELPPLTARRILVVDDNRDSAESMAQLLTLMGNVTRTAYDGIEAIEAAATFSPALVLLDIGSPRLNGYEVARRIRKQWWSKGMLLVAVTGWAQEEDRQRSKEAGFDGHLVKPVDHTALTKILTRLLPVEEDSPRHDKIANA